MNNGISTFLTKSLLVLVTPFSFHAHFCLTKNLQRLSGSHYCRKIVLVLLQNNVCTVIMKTNYYFHETWIHDLNQKCVSNIIIINLETHQH